MDAVTFALADSVGIVTLNRPAKLNAMDEQVFAGLRDAAAEAAGAAAAGRCRAVLVRGAGRAFSAGLDVALFAQQVHDPPGDEEIAAMQASFTCFEDLPVPVVAAMRGATLGAGAQLALACHLRLAAPDLAFGLLEVRWGLLPDLGGMWRLPRVVGLQHATELALTARTIDAGTAVSWGLAAAAPDGVDFGEAALAYTQRLAQGPTTALSAIPGLLRASLDGDRGAVLAAERRAQQRCLTSADFAEAATAAAEGREPRFEGR